MTCGRPTTRTPTKNKELRDLDQKLDQVTHDLGALEVDFDDWQVLYRQILQVGRAIHGHRQLDGREGLGDERWNEFAQATRLRNGDRSSSSAWGESLLASTSSVVRLLT